MFSGLRNKIQYDIGGHGYKKNLLPPPPPLSYLTSTCLGCGTEEEGTMEEVGRIGINSKQAFRFNNKK